MFSDFRNIVTKRRWLDVRTGLGSVSPIPSLTRSGWGGAWHSRRVRTFGPMYCTSRNFVMLFSTPVFQGWEFAHRFSKRIAHFLQKKCAKKRFAQTNERFAQFLVSDLSDSLKLLIFDERPERFAHISYEKRGNERIAQFLNKKTYIKHTK